MIIVGVKIADCESNEYNRLISNDGIELRSDTNLTLQNKLVWKILLTL